MPQGSDAEMGGLHEQHTFTYELVSANKKKRFSHAVGFTMLLALVGGVSVWAGFETARRMMPSGVTQAENIAFSGIAVSAPERPRDSSADSHLQVQQPELSLAPALPEDSRRQRRPAQPDLDNAELNRLPIQQRAELLLESAMRGDRPSLDVLRQNVDTWRGQLHSTERLFDLILTALNSSDLQVRTAALDLDLAANNLGKTPRSVDRLLREMHTDPSSIGMCLWRLGALGNRGVQPDKVLRILLLYARSRDEHTRYWAVEGLGMLGNDSTIDPLLTVMAHDASPRVRELAASSLGHAGMLTREERLAAVPALLNFADDDSLNTATRELVYATLRLITGAELGNDTTAWREWWANHDPAHEKPREHTGIVRT
jgi:hypothetical protein